MEFLALLIWLLLAGTGAILAGVVGLQLPFYFAVAFVALLIARPGTDPVV